MRNGKFFIVIPIIIFLAILGSGCGSNDDAATTVDRAVNAMGGQVTLQSVDTQLIVTAGQRFEPEQTVTPGDTPRNVSDFQLTQSWDIGNNRLRLDWQWNILYPFPGPLAYADVMDGQIGFVDGPDSNNSPPQAPMESVRVATLRKLHRLTSPLFLLRTAIENRAVVEIRPDENFQGKLHHVIGLPDAVSPIRIFLDAATLLPTKADTIEDDPYFGDMLMEAIFANWQQVGGVMEPFTLTVNINNITIHTETRSNIQHNVQFQAGIFDIPANMQTPFDAADAARGEINSQWFARFQSMGLPTYTDQSQTVVFTEVLPGVAPGVFHVTGGSHHSLVVEMADHLIVIEAPLYEERSQAVIAEIEARFPGKPIRTIVATHFHFDHDGGIRAYAAKGADLVVGADSVSRFRVILDTPHTLKPDALQNNPRVADIAPVTSFPLNLTDNIRNVDIYPVTNSHSSDLVVAYLPQARLLFVSDIFNPSGDFAAADLPPELLATIQQFSLDVGFIAGGHGVFATAIPGP